MTSPKSSNSVWYCSLCDSSPCALVLVFALYGILGVFGVFGIDILGEHAAVPDVAPINTAVMEAGK